MRCRSGFVTPIETLNVRNGVANPVPLNLLARLHSSPRGEKAWPPLMMFKALLLQSGYVLSDPALEKKLARDLLFHRFLGLNISESVPDHSNLWRFRQLLKKQKHLRIQTAYPIMPVGVCNPDRNVCMLQ